jgi:hypothetical protein
MAIALGLSLSTLVFVIVVMMRSISDERDKRRSIWRQFGLSIALMAMFFITWIGHGVAQWQTFTDEQQAHNEPVMVGDFVNQFAESTLENWQSEFLQLFSFVVLAALLIHKGSSESKDGDEKLEASLRRLEEKLGTLPSDAPKAKAESWKLPDTPQKLAG